MPKKKKTVYVCQECGYDTPKWMGRCPGCGAWNTLVEETVAPEPTTRGGGLRLGLSDAQKPQPIAEVKLEDMPRFLTGSGELDRVLGGGIIPSSMVLIVGDPGVGKSSLTLRVCADVARQGKKVLYVTGEESTRQVRMRADRLQALADDLLVVSETNLETIETHVENVKPELLVIDSIQTIFKPDVQSAPGSVSQVRECAVDLLRIAKTNGIAAFIIGHVTKDGTLAGPRVLEHIVDTVLYFEGERNAEYRVLRAVKNRFGSTNELGLFEMRDVGLVDVPDASKLFLSDREQDTGTVIIPTVEGTRPLLVELQALVAPTPTCRRAARPTPSTSSASSCSWPCSRSASTCRSAPATSTSRWRAVSASTSRRRTSASASRWPRALQTAPATQDHRLRRGRTLRRSARREPGRPAHPRGEASRLPPRRAADEELPPAQGQRRGYHALRRRDYRRRTAPRHAARVVRQMTAVRSICPSSVL